MKFRTTKREIMEGYTNIIKIGYCNAQSLLRYHDPVAYTCSKDGWNSDIYFVGSVAISTGYSPFGNIIPSYDTVKKYNDEAAVICNDSAFDWEVGKAKVDELLMRFIREVTGDS